MVAVGGWTGLSGSGGSEGAREERQVNKQALDCIG